MVETVHCDAHATIYVVRFLGNLGLDISGYFLANKIFCQNSAAVTSNRICICNIVLGQASENQD